MCKSQLLVQPARPRHRWWRHSTESYSGDLLGDFRFFNLKTTNFKPYTKKSMTPI